ncbi:recombinase family protein [Escherichia coli]|uniref:recombinase family protein n=1 Tax=Escherichia coli TaxID=562 RepID=UPI001E4FC263|nr:recombinase family protein [Escherichia coli]MCD1388305.1 recombinase family protein [Escherichia coli]
MKKCFIYHRVSSDQQLSGGRSGIVRQAENLNLYVKRIRLLETMDDPEAVILCDQGVSAFKGLNISEGELGRWMEQVQAGMWDGSHFVLESIDRFSRQNPFTLVGYLSRLVEHDITLHDVSLNLLINRSNSAMLPIVTMSAQRAYEESKIKSDRIRDGWRRKREQAFNNGTIVTNKRPQWIDIRDDQYVLNDKVHIVKEVFRLAQSGIGTPTIAKILNAKGDDWLFESGRQWRGESVHKLLKNKRVTGSIFISEIIRDYNSTSNPVDQKRYEMDVYPIVISKEEFNLVQQLLRSRRANTGRISTNKDTDELKKSNIFNSICRCGKCGEAMYHNVVKSHRNSKKNGKFTEEYRYIRCLGERDNLCDNKALRYEVVEQFVLEYLKGMDFSRILKPNNHKSEIDVLRLNIDEEKKHIREYRQGIEKLKSMGKKVPFDVLVELEESQKRLSDLEEKESKYTDLTVDTEYLKSVDPSVLFDQGNIEVRSRIEKELSMLLESIVLHRLDKHYVITLEYTQVNILKHVLFIEAGKIPVLMSTLSIEKYNDEHIYTMPSFSIRCGEGVPEIHGEAISLVDYSLLLNYIDGVDGSEYVSEWMRTNQNFIFSKET